jgi:integrase
MAKKLKLTKRSVEALPIKTTRYDVFDADLTGFHVRVSPSGRKTYHLYYRTNSGHERRPKIGQHGLISCEQARDAAANWLAEVTLGGDPGQARSEARQAPSVADMCERYLEHCQGRLKASTVATYAWLISKVIVPALGARKIGELQRREVELFQRSLATTPRNANQAISLLGTILTYAESHGLIEPGRNPCLHIPAFKTRRLERYLSPDEMQRLLETLDRFEREQRASPHAVAAIRLLLTTGCRKNEICKLQWAHVDLDSKSLHLPDSKTGAKRVRLNTIASDILAAIPRIPGNPFVIAGEVSGQPLVGLQRIWERVRAEAELEDVRLHDLRHNFASQAISMGVPLPVIGELLGHKSLQATSRYAHLADDPVREASERVGKLIAESSPFGR